MNLILKKSAAFLLVFLTLMFVGVSSVFADNSVTISGNKCSSGDTITYICMIQTDKRLSGINATLKYPAASLELQKESVNVPNLGMTIANTNDEGRIRFIGVNAQEGFDFTEKKLLVSATFKVKNNAQNGSIEIDFEEVTDVDLAEVDMEKVVVEETVKKGSYDGDIVNPQSGDEYVEAEEASPEDKKNTVIIVTALSAAAVIVAVSVIVSLKRRKVNKGSDEAKS